ncbi:MAG: DUF3500 domain-containing protein [Planctomycetota bacterium]|nr:DUF3500 domain-containing protein [Planctomycetota bacterium]
MNLPRRLSALSALLLAACTAVVPAPQPGPGEARRETALRAFLDTLDEAQLREASAPLDSKDRVDWHYIPRERPGIHLKDLDPRQRTALNALLDATLSSQGHLKVDGIVRLEDVLHDLESKPGAPATHRDPGLYAFRVFGTPGSGPWAWKLEGHHLSLNFTSDEDGPTRTTPFFVGANPARIPSGKYAGSRVLAVEEDLGREIALALDEHQLEHARLAGATPMEVVLAPGVDRNFEHPEGLLLGDLRPDQLALVERMLDEFAGNLAPDLEALARARFRADGLDALRFGWSGGTRVGEPHYWRIAGSRFAIEYADVDGGANHFHCVWRDFEHDFGADLLREHLATDHAHAGQ